MSVVAKLKLTGVVPAPDTTTFSFASEDPPVPVTNEDKEKARVAAEKEPIVSGVAGITVNNKAGEGTIKALTELFHGGGHVTMTIAEAPKTAAEKKAEAAADKLNPPAK